MVDSRSEVCSDPGFSPLAVRNILFTPAEGGRAGGGMFCCLLAFFFLANILIAAVWRIIDTEK